MATSQVREGSLPPLDRDQRALAGRLQAHVHELASEIGERHVWRPAALSAAARYIKQQLRTDQLEVFAQAYEVEGQRVKNLEVQLVGKAAPREVVVVGAHYDTVPGTPGANDNGSGVAALIELARRFSARAARGEGWRRTLRFVAFVNEEPPFFQTERMGSLVYARRCKARKERVKAMLSLETIGYYSDERGSQQYPFPFSAFYPDTGNFVGFIGNLGSRRLVSRTVAAFRREERLPAEGVAVPGFITGVGWSDHWSFWQVGYPALMVTDTAPFRYRHYHQGSDTADRLDYERMARLVVGLEPVIAALAGR